MRPQHSLNPDKVRYLVLESKERRLETLNSTPLPPNREHNVYTFLLYLDNGHVNHSEVPKSCIFQEFPPEKESISKVAHQEE